MKSFIQRIFSEKVSVTYELVNHVLTFGLDIVWRRAMTKIASCGNQGRWLDVCTGTGETAAYLSRRAGKETIIYGADISPDMLFVARHKPEAQRIHFTLANVAALPFADNTFDLITISFATRNINLNKNTLVHTFAEFHRVLKPGGCFINLETSQPVSPFMRKLFHLYIKLWVKPIGSRLSGSKEAYTYLSYTIPRFYSAKGLSALMTAAGFGKVTYRTRFLGIAAIHQGKKMETP